MGASARARTWGRARGRGREGECAGWENGEERRNSRAQRPILTALTARPNAWVGDLWNRWSGAATRSARTTTRGHSAVREVGGRYMTWPKGGGVAVGYTCPAGQGGQANGAEPKAGGSNPPRRSSGNSDARGVSHDSALRAGRGDREAPVPTLRPDPAATRFSRGSTPPSGFSTNPATTKGREAPCA